MSSTSRDTLIKISEAVRDHLTQQKALSVMMKGEQEACRYIQPQTGNRCAVGCLLDDQFYLPVFEGIAVPSNLVIRDNLTSEDPDWKSEGLAMQGLQDALLKSLQLRGFDVWEWTDNLHDLLNNWQIYHDSQQDHCNPMYRRWLTLEQMGDPESADDSPQAAHEEFVRRLN